MPHNLHSFIEKKKLIKPKVLKIEIKKILFFLYALEHKLEYKL